MNIWVLDMGDRVLKIKEERPNFFTVENSHWSDNSTSSLWFFSYQSARNYCKNELHAEGKFKKVISQFENV